MSIYFKGRHRCRCYNPNKPEKWHFKAFCLNDGGYLWNFYMYQVATEQRPPEWSATAYPIKKLLEPLDPGAKTKNRVMCLDNWYTSIEVAIFLWLVHKMYLIGTIKINRKGLPHEHILKKSGPQKKRRGAPSSVMATIQGVACYFTAWMDSKPVHGLSTLPTYVDKVERIEPVSSPPPQSRDLQCGCITTKAWVERIFTTS